MKEKLKLVKPELKANLEEPRGSQNENAANQAEKEPTASEYMYIID